MDNLWWVICDTTLKDNVDINDKSNTMVITGKPRIPIGVMAYQIDICNFREEDREWIEKSILPFGAFSDAKINYM